MSRHVKIINHGVVVDTVSGDLIVGGVSGLRRHETRNDGAVADMICSILTKDELMMLIARLSPRIRRLIPEQGASAVSCAELIIPRLREAGLVREFFDELKRLRPYQSSYIESVSALLIV